MKPFSRITRRRQKVRDKRTQVVLIKEEKKKIRNINLLLLEKNRSTKLPEK
jgi:hypothetical protein